MATAPRSSFMSILKHSRRASRLPQPVRLPHKDERARLQIGIGDDRPGRGSNRGEAPTGRLHPTRDLSRIERVTLAPNRTQQATTLGGMLQGLQGLINGVSPYSSPAYIACPPSREREADRRRSRIHRSVNQISLSSRHSQGLTNLPTG